jgi:hypothetical protein
VKEFTPILFHSDDGMGDIKIDTINDTSSETNAKISILEDEEDVSQLSMEEDEASEVTQVSCIVDKCSSVQGIDKQLNMLWNSFADLSRTIKKKHLPWAFFKRGIKGCNSLREAHEFCHPPPPQNF